MSQCNIAQLGLSTMLTCLFSVTILATLRRIVLKGTAAAHQLAEVVAKSAIM